MLPSDYAEQYERLDQNYAHLYTVAAQRLVELARVSPGDSVIDVGAGTGISTEAVANVVFPGGRVLAIDPSSVMLKCAAKKSILRNVERRQGGARDLAPIAIETGFSGRTDVILSSFTYYYTFEERPQFYADVQKVLRPGGCLVFNLTRYLGELRIDGRVYNRFSTIYLDRLRSVLRQRGIDITIDSDETSEQFRDTSWEVDQLRVSGFTDVRVEAWPMPLRPSDAYRFTLDGFYGHGSRVTFLPGLMSMTTKARVDVLKEALATCASELDACEPPHVANIVAYKTAQENPYSS